jgi:hypothetical protein
MNPILRIVFAIVVGVLVTSVLEWLTPVPHGIDVLLGVVAAFLAWYYSPNHTVGL